MLLIMINDAGFAAPSTTDGQVRAKQAVIYGKREDRNGHAGQASSRYHWAAGRHVMCPVVAFAKRWR